jgi:glycosyltransferase involved in cell wall biosynthesis
LLQRFKIYRESNIEHVYYFKLSKAESNYLKKIYFYVEALKLETFEKVLKSADKLLLVSQSDCDYFAKKFGKEKTIYLPSFHPNEKISCQIGKGLYALYHGNLSVPENNIAAIFLVKKVFSQLDIPFKIAGMDPSSNLIDLCKKNPNIELIANPSNEVMNQLIEAAHINCLYTHQATGLKLKLINVLFRGRFCLTNTDMLEGSNLEDLCVIADNQITYAEQVKKLFQKEFSMDEIEKRKSTLSVYYDNQSKAKMLYELIQNKK